MNSILVDIKNSKEKKFGLYEAALATLLYLVFSTGFLWIYRMCPAFMRTGGSVWFYIASFLVEAIFGVTAYVVATSKKISFLDAIGAKKKINGDIVFYGVLISFVCLIFLGNITDSFIELLSLLGYSSVLSPIKIDNFGIYLVYVITTCLSPALFEEILFRGTIASGLKQLGFKVALIASALIFTFMHGNPEQTVHQFVIGVLIGYIFLKTGNLWIGVIIHFINNFSAITMLYIGGLIYGDELYETSNALPESTVGSFFINLIVAVILAVIGYKILKLLIAKIFKVNDMINTNNVKLEENAVVKVDDAEVAVKMTVDGENIDNSNEHEDNAEPDAVVQSGGVKEDKKIPVTVIVMFALAGAYLAFEWISSLLIGLGVI